MVLDMETIFPTAETGADEYFIQEAEQALRPRFVFKTANQSKTADTTLANDPELFMSLSADSTYEFELILGFDTSYSADPGINITFTGPTGSTGAYYLSQYFWDFIAEVGAYWKNGDTNDVLTVGTPLLLSAAAYASEVWGGEEIGTIFKGIIKTGNVAGNLHFQWAQKITDADDTKVYAGSMLKVTRQ